MSTIRTNTLQTLDSAITIDVEDIASKGYVDGIVTGNTAKTVDNITALKAIDHTASTRVQVLGYYVPGDGGGGIYYYDGTDLVSADNGGTIIVATDGARWKLSQVGRVSVKQFGAKADNATDDSIAINASISALNYAYLPNGNYRIAASVTLNTNQRLLGESRPGTIITSVTPGHSVIIAANAEYAQVRDLRITRPAGQYGTSSGKDGIHCNGYAQLVFMDDIEVTRHFRGLSLGPTSYSFVSNYLIDNNYDDGIHVEGTATIGAMQWTFFKGISQRNNGCGMKFQTVAGPSGASMGDLVSVSTYGNKIDGIAWQGIPSCPINAIRVRGAFVGEEGRHGIYMDTYGVSTHTLADVFSEICGTLASGVDGTTPPTNQGNGFLITANQQDVMLTGCNAIGNSWTGLSSSAVRVTVTGGQWRLNGAALLAGEMTGIQANAGSMVISGVRANGNKAFGVFFANDNHIITSSDLRENLTSGLAAGVTLTNTVDLGNRKL